MTLLLETLEFLVAAIVVVPLFKRFGLSAVLGHLSPQRARPRANS